MSKRWAAVEADGDWLVLKQVETDEWFRGCGTPITTQDLIAAFKSTKYFNDLIDTNTIAIYVVGSRAIGLEKLTSDLDLIVIVDNPEIDVDGKLADTRLAYKGVAVHWKFYDYRELFYVNTSADKLAVFRQHICCRQPTHIYLADRGKKLNEYLMQNKLAITEFGAKLVAFSYKTDLLQYNDRILQRADLKKTLYHLVMASEILSGGIDYNFLLDVKQASPYEYNRLANMGFIDRLTDEIHWLIKYTASIDYNELSAQADIVNRNICNIVAN